MITYNVKEKICYELPSKSAKGWLWASNHGDIKKQPKTTHRKWQTIQDGKCDKSIPDSIFFQAFITDNLLHPIQVFFSTLRQALGRRKLERGKPCRLIDDQCWYSQWNSRPRKKVFFHPYVFLPLPILIHVSGVLNTFLIDSWISQIYLVQQQTWNFNNVALLS